MERKPLPLALEEFNRDVTACRKCGRLVAWREKIARDKKRAYLDLEYWGKPVPGFGDPNARVFILGLAPGAHGSNRTGRPFTGDASGNFMYPVLYNAGFASQPNGKSRDDGMVLTDAYISAAARCAPPQNKPTPRELANCAPLLDRELALLTNLRIVVALGRIGWEAYLSHLRRIGVIESKTPYAFVHGAEYTTPDGKALVASFHPSLQNTNTGKLTEPMFAKLFMRVAELARGAKI